MWKSMMLGACCALVAASAVAAPSAECVGPAPTTEPVPAELLARCGASAAAAGPGASAPSDLALGIDALGGPDLVSFALDAPELFTTLAPGSSPSGQPITGCDFDGSGALDRLFCIDNGQPATFLFVETATGTLQVLSHPMPLDGEYFTSVSTDPRSHEIYLTSANCTTETAHLYKADLQSFELAPVAAITGVKCLLATGFDRAGRLYGVDATDDVLVRINKRTGVGAAIGPLGFDANFAQGMDFDESDGTCYLFAFNQDNAIGMRAELRTCDTATGATTFVGTLGATAPGGSTEITGAGVATVGTGGCGGGAGSIGAAASAGSAAPWVASLAALAVLRRRSRRRAP